LLRSRVFWFLAGSFLASIFWVWKYDPSLFGLTANAPHPVRPPEPGPGTIVVQPLAQAWDFDNEKVPWEPILPLAQLSESAYREGVELDVILKKLGLAKVSEFPAGSMYAYVASNDKAVVVAFRGTNADELQDWLADADIASEAVMHGRIHSGFYRSTQSILAPISAAVKEHGGDAKFVWVTGHSLGGAMALAFVYDVLTSGEIKPTGLVTFGQPLVVNGELAQFLNQQLKGKYLRFVNGGDVVPRVFPTFSHCGNLVWFVNDGYEFRRPQALAPSTRDPEATPRLDYASAPPPLTVGEFQELQTRLKEQPRARARDLPAGEVQTVRAPAFLEDHHMSGYIHWVLVLKDRESRRP
jgi:Lipase (class 3)